MSKKMIFLKTIHCQRERGKHFHSLTVCRCGNNYNSPRAAQSEASNKGRRWELQIKVEGEKRGRSKKVRKSKVLPMRKWLQRARELLNQRWLWQQTHLLYCSAMLWVSNQYIYCLIVQKNCLYLKFIWLYDLPPISSLLEESKIGQLDGQKTFHKSL